MMRTIADLIGAHAGADVFVCGTGTSLAGFDWTRLNECATIALNDAINARGFEPTYHLWADDHLYERYFKHYPQTVAIVPSVTAHLLAGDYDDAVTYTHRENTERVIVPDCDPRWPEPYGQFRFAATECSEDGDDLYCSHTVATAGVLLAAKLGARRIFLVGCDAYTTEAANYWDGRPPHMLHHRPVPLGDGRWRTSAHIYWDMELTRLREWFAERARYAGPWPAEGVYNTSELSTLTAWDKVPLETALKAEEAYHGNSFVCREKCGM